MTKVHFSDNHPFSSDPLQEILPGVFWGRPEWVPSAAFWHQVASLALIDEALFSPAASLLEETVFCLLGGYGISAEVNCAAFQHLRAADFLSMPSVAAQEIEASLRMPLDVVGRRVYYRFPKQRAARLSTAIGRLRNDQIPFDCPRALRSYLMTINGIGPKTASWIVRNLTGSDEVAILDIHIHRAGLLIGLFNPNQRLPKDYFEMERRFLQFAEAIQVRPSLLDAVMWSTMRTLGVPTELSKRRQEGGKRGRPKQRWNHNQETTAVEAAR